MCLWARACLHCVCICIQVCGHGQACGDGHAHGCPSVCAHACVLLHVCACTGWALDCRFACIVKRNVHIVCVRAHVPYGTSWTKSSLRGTEGWRSPQELPSDPALACPSVFFPSSILLSALWPSFCPLVFFLSYSPLTALKSSFYPSSVLLSFSPLSILEFSFSSFRPLYPIVLFLSRGPDLACLFACSCSYSCMHMLILMHALFCPLLQLLCIYPPALK